MRKSIQNSLALFVVMVSIFTFINMISVDRAEAVSCPEGLVCTPVQSGASICPVGYTCTPAPTCPVGYTCKPIEIQPTTCPSGYICKLTNNGGGSSGGSGGGGLSNRCYRFETDLSVGGFWTRRSTGADVVALQTILMEKGFDIPSISSKGVAKGVFGTETKSALMRYQASVGIPATGVADPQTRSVLNSLCSSTDNPSITVLSPMSGSRYSVGSKISIRWTFSNFPVPNNPPVDVLLIRKVSGDAYTGVTTITENVLGGSYDWTIPASIPNGSSYMITIQTKGQTVNGMEQKGYGSRSGIFSITGSTNFISASISPVNVVAGNSIRVTVDTRNSDVNDKTKKIILSLQSSDGSSYIPSNFIYSKDSQGRWYADYIIPSTAKQGTWIIRQIGLFDDNKVLKYLNYPDDINYVFTVGGSTPAPTPYSTPITTSNTTNREAFAVSLLSTKVDKAGAWHTFAPGIGAGGTGGTTDPADWNWSAFLMLSSSKTVSSVTIRQANGEYWSTNNKQYFPLVIIDENGKQLTSQYVDNLITLPKGTYSWSLYGQKNTSSWVDGGYAEIAFSDGTKIKSYISANSKPVFICPVGFICNNNSPSPTPVSSPSLSPSYPPSVTVTSPNSGEFWSMGDKKTITWSYANWNSGIFGNKYVDMYLVPMDGRSPMKLATNFNSPDGTVHVTIYEKTSDGRNAWLPGRYKIRVVCNTNNVAPFNSCMDESDGYITVVSNPPSPTPVSSPTSMIDQNVLNASIWDAIKQYFDSKTNE